MKNKEKNNVVADKSETITEGIFRRFYGDGAFIEKSAIPAKYGFKSKKNTNYKGYPDFFRDNSEEDFVIVVEAKADNFREACSEVRFYATHNEIEKDIVAIAISGQSESSYKSALFLKFKGKQAKKIATNDKLLVLNDIKKIYRREKYGESVHRFFKEDVGAAQ